MTFADTLKGTKEGSEKIIHIDDPALSDEIGEEFKSQLMDEIELLDGASADFDMDLVTKGELSPVFSALLLQTLVSRHFTAFP